MTATYRADGRVKVEEGEARYSEEVLQAVDAGRKIEAIKRLRDETGLGLKEAKDEIDRLAAQRPQVAVPHSEHGGLGAVVKIMILALILFALYLYFL